jgi:putative copper resistance protein D
MAASTLAPLTVHAVLTRWQFAPVVTVGVLLAGALYAWGVLRVRRRHPARPWPLRSSAAFAAALGVLVVATESGIGVYAGLLFWIHMVQHILLIMAVPLLAILGRPLTLLLHASRNPLHTWAKRVLRSRPVAVVSHPLVALALYAVAVMGTHLTGFANLAITNPVAGAGERTLYLVAGLLFFLPLVGREPVRWQLMGPMRIFLIALAMPIDTFTGVILGQTNHELFPAYAAVHRTWGLSPVADLHAGGAVMWIGGDGMMAVLFVLSFAGWARQRTVADQGAGAWIEQSRSRELAAKTGVTGAHQGRAVDNDEQLAAYNAYLSRLAGGRAPPDAPTRH